MRQPNFSPAHWILSALIPFVCLPAMAENMKQSAPKAQGFIIKYRQINQRALTQQAGDGSRIMGQPSDYAMRAQSVRRMTGMNVQFQHQMGTGAYVFRSNDTMSAKQALALAKKIEQQDRQIDYAEPDYINTHQAIPNSPLYVAEQWSMQTRSPLDKGALNLPGAWDISEGKDVTVAVLDTGILYHPDVKRNILDGYSFISSPESSSLTAKPLLDRHGNAMRDESGTPITSARTNNPVDQGDHCDKKTPPAPSSWHGTHVTGIIAANAGNSGGLVGVAPKAKILPVRVLGKCGGKASDIVDGMIWAAGGVIPGAPVNKNPARVLNLSLGGAYPCSKSYRDAIETVNSLGAIIVVAAGNNTEDSSGFSPGSCPGIISVAANGKTSGIASYSNYGSFVTVTAPGGDGDSPIVSTLNTGTTVPVQSTYEGKSGTSMATPHVAGVIALMLSVNPRLDFKAVRKILINTAHEPANDCEGCSEGIVDATAAVRASVPQ